MEDEVNLEITGYDWQTRRSEIESFLTTTDAYKEEKYLRDNDIEYLYWVKEIHGPITEKKRLITKVFENDEIQIFRYTTW